MRSEESEIQMIGRASASTLEITGGSASTGRRDMTRPTLSRTSLVAPSMARSMRNSSEIEDEPSRLDEVIVLMPSMPESASSRICVTWTSMMFGDAPL